VPSIIGKGTVPSSKCTMQALLDELEIIPDHHPKILLTLDTIGNGSNYGGIRQINLLDWLLGQN